MANITTRNKIRRKTRLNQPSSCDRQTINNNDPAVNAIAILCLCVQTTKVVEERIVPITESEPVR